MAGIIARLAPDAEIHNYRVFEEGADDAGEGAIERATGAAVDLDIDDEPVAVGDTFFAAFSNCDIEVDFIMPGSGIVSWVSPSGTGVMSGTSMAAPVATALIAGPQRQGFNGGVWLALEDYIVDNSDDEEIRATVLTGPVFDEDDPEYEGVRVSIEFWKIVVFVNPLLKEPKAIAYKRSQATYLPRRARAASRFVFGDFHDTQVSIASLADETGLDLSAYAKLDVLKKSARSLSVRLASVEDAFLTP